MEATATVGHGLRLVAADGRWFTDTLPASIKQDHYDWGTVLAGRPAQLLEAGVVRADQLPGFGANPKRVCRWLADGTRFRGESGALGRPCVVIYKFPGDRLVVWLVHSAEERGRRLEARARRAELEERRRVAEAAERCRADAIARRPQDAAQARQAALSGATFLVGCFRDEILKSRGGWRVGQSTQRRVEMLLEQIRREFERAEMVFDGAALAAEDARLEEAFRATVGEAPPRPTLRLVRT